MDEQKKMGFFKKMFLAITDFRCFPFALRTESLFASFRYWTLLLLLMSLIISLHFSNIMFDNVDIFIEKYDKEGDRNQTVEINEDIILMIDTRYTYDEFLKTSIYEENKKVDMKILVNSDVITFIENGVAQPVGFGEFDSSTLFEEFKQLYGEIENRIFFVFTLFISLFIAYFIIKGITLIFLSVFASIVCALFGIKINYKNYFKIAIYAVTLPYIVEIISMIFVGGIEDYTQITKALLVYVYVFYAVRAIKLDAVLIIMGKNKRKNIIINGIKRNDEDEVLSQENDGGKTNTQDEDTSNETDNDKRESEEKEDK